MATRRSRIQIKPNTGRTGGSEVSGKPAPTAPRPAIASPRTYSSAKHRDRDQASSNDLPSADPPLPKNSEIPAEAAIMSTPVPESPIPPPPVSDEPPPPVSVEVPAKPSVVEAVSEALVNEPKESPTTGKGKGRPRVPKPQPNLREASARIARRRSVEAAEVPEEEQEPLHSEPNGTTNEERQPGQHPPSPPPRHPPKTAAEKRARKENKELQGRKRRRYRPGGKGAPPDRSSMTMMDLIYYNPPGNPMPEKPPKATVVEEIIEENPPQEEEETVAEEGSVGPRVRVGPDGEITIDEESLVIRREPAREDSRTVVYETGTETHYGSFRKRPFGRRLWSTKETARFYRALSVCGTDFTLMSTFFPKRTRQDLKNKFKREERFNRELVDKAINDPTQFDTVGLEDEEEEEDVDDPDKVGKAGKDRRSSPAPQKRKKGRPRKKPSQGEEVLVEQALVVEDPTADNVVPIYDDEDDGSSTPPPSCPPAACTTPLSSTTPVRGSVPQGQLVFYASHAEERVVHVFVVSPRANASASELVSRLGTPPLGRQTTPTRAQNASVGTAIRAVGSPPGEPSANDAREPRDASGNAPTETPTATRPQSLPKDSIVPLAKLCAPQRQPPPSSNRQEGRGASGNFCAAGLLPKGITPLSHKCLPHDAKDVWRPATGT